MGLIQILNVDLHWCISPLWKIADTERHQLSDECKGQRNKRRLRAVWNIWAQNNDFIFLESTWVLWLLIRIRYFSSQNYVLHTSSHICHNRPKFCLRFGRSLTGVDVVVDSLKSCYFGSVIVVAIIVDNNLLQKFIAVCCFDIKCNLFVYFMPFWS